MSLRRQQIDTRSAAKLVASLVGHDNVISISRLILQLLGGDYPSAILLCQSIYWQSKVEEGKGGTKDGYFWKSMADWHREIALSEYQVRTATKRLLKAGFLETTTRKAWSEESHDKVPTVHYLVNMDNLLESLISLVSTESTPKKINFQIHGKCRIDSEEIDATLYTETTQKTKTTTTASPNQHQEEAVEEYIRRETDRAAHAGEIRKSRVKYAAGIRKQINREGGRLTPERREQLVLWRSPPTALRTTPTIDPDAPRGAKGEAKIQDHEIRARTLARLPPWEQEIVRTRKYLKETCGE